MFIQMGGDKEQNVTISQTLNGFHLTKPLVLNVFQTEDEFTSALINSGLYSQADEEEKIAASPWTKSFQTNLVIEIKRTPIYIDFGTHTFTKCSITAVSGVPLPAPLVLDLLQTEDEFTAAIKRSGLLSTEEDNIATDQAIVAAFSSFGFKLKPNK